MDPFASHVCRALLALLMPGLFPAEQKSSVLRSKKSAAYKARQGPMKSLFTPDKDATSAHQNLKAVPPKYRDIARKFVMAVREKLGANEVRALAASPVASPVLQVCTPSEFFTHTKTMTDVARSRSRAHSRGRARFTGRPCSGWFDYTTG